eukprot:2487077-Alexandrium_andersonii.AAC.1
MPALAPAALFGQRLAHDEAAELQVRSPGFPLVLLGLVGPVERVLQHDVVHALMLLLLGIELVGLT